MALSAKAGNFAINTSTGNQAITGLGFTPKLILFFPAGENTAAGIINNERMGFGVGISSADRRALATNSQNGQISGTPVRNHTNTKCFEVFANNSAVTTLYAADFVSLDADGFTINVATAPASAYQIGYLALGGADITNVKSGQLISNTVTGNQAITGVGFQPDSLLFFSPNRGTAPPDAATSGSFGLGFGKSSTARGAASFANVNAVNPTQTKRYQRTIETLSTSGGATEFDLVSMDADGFTINWLTAPSTPVYEHFLAIKGGQFNVSSFNTPTVTGNFSKTGVGFQPVAAIFLSKLAAANTASDTDAYLSLGVATSSTQRFVNGCFDQNGVATSKSRHWFATTKIYATYNTAGPTLLEDIDFVSFDADGFTLNETTSDATAREVIYMTFGSNVVSATPKGGFFRFM